MLKDEPKSRQQPSAAGSVARRINHVLLALLLCARGAVALDGYWIDSRGGNWTSAANWDAADGIAGGADNTAYFGFAREATIAPDATFALSGPQTIGNLCFTFQGGSSSWSFNSSAGGSLTLEATFGLPQITVTSPSQQVSLNVVLAGNGGVEKDGPGTLVLAAQNTYAGETLVTGGGLDIAGSIGTGQVQVNNATLSGTGSINGPVVIGSGSTFSPGDASGPLTINSSLLLLPGSTTAVSLNGHPVVQGLAHITYGGNLLVNNVSGSGSLGANFSLFGAGSASGNFSSIQPAPGPWLRWRFDPASGQISVVSSASQPAFSNVSLAGNNLVLQVTNGPPGATFYLTSATDLSLPKAAWTRIGTNVFDVTGNSICTNAINRQGANQLYLAAFLVPSP